MTVSFVLCQLSFFTWSADDVHNFDLFYFVGPKTVNSSHSRPRQKILFSRSIILSIYVCVWHSPMSKLLFFICICRFNSVIDLFLFFILIKKKLSFGCCSSSIVCTGQYKGLVKPVRYEQVVGWPVFCVFHPCIGMLATACTYHFVSSFLSSPEKWGIKWFHWIFNIILQLPGVDPNDQSVKDLLASMQSQTEVSPSSLLVV